MQEHFDPLQPWHTHSAMKKTPKVLPKEQRIFIYNLSSLQSVCSRLNHGFWTKWSYIDSSVSSTVCFFISQAILLNISKLQKVLLQPPPLLHLTHTQPLPFEKVNRDVRADRVSDHGRTSDISPASPLSNTPPPHLSWGGFTLSSTPMRPRPLYSLPTSSRGISLRSPIPSKSKSLKLCLTQILSPYITP